MSFSSNAMAETPPEIRTVHNQECEINAAAIAQAAQKRGEFIAGILASSSPGTPQREALMEDLKKAVEFTDNKAFERASNEKKLLLEKNIDPAIAGAIKSLMIYVDKMAWTIAMEEPGLTAIGYQRRIEQQCKQGLK